MRRKRSQRILISFAMDIKQKNYTRRIANLLNSGFTNVIPVLDNKDELREYAKSVKGPFKLGIRVAAEEEPTFPFYTSRLGIRAKDIWNFMLTGSRVMKANSN
jgi:arginine decarboxylase